MLHGRASLRPRDIAFTFTDYDDDPAGVPESLTWSQLSRRTLSNAHGVNVGDLVLVPPGSIPTTTSGKIRRAACVERYRQDQFTRLDA